MKDKSLKTAEKAAKDSLAKVIDTYDAWQILCPYLKNTELMEHEKNNLNPIGK